VSAPKTEKVRQQLEAALAGVSLELQKGADGGPSVSSERELRLIQIELREMLESLNRGAKRKIPGLWRLIIDTWPYDNELRHAIVEAEFNYERWK